MSSERFSLESAQAAAARDEIARWVGDFLASRGSDNEVLGAALADRRHWWLGPTQIALDRLERLAGPEDDAICPIDGDEWDSDVGDMADSLDEGWEPPPLIAEHQDGRLVLQDGNHRFEAMERAGHTHGWVIVYFDDPDERDRFMSENPVAASSPVPDS